MDTLSDSSVIEVPKGKPAIDNSPLDSPLYKWGNIPFRHEPMVDFPEPDGPTISTFSPGKISKFIFLMLDFFANHI